MIAEVILVRSAGMGLFLNKYVRPGLVPNHIIEKLAKAPDKERTSIEIIRDLVKGLKEVCQGVHFIPVGSVDRLSKYLDAVEISIYPMQKELPSQCKFFSIQGDECLQEGIGRSDRGGKR